MHIKNACKIRVVLVKNMNVCLYLYADNGTLLSEK